MEEVETEILRQMEIPIKLRHHRFAEQVLLLDLGIAVTFCGLSLTSRVIIGDSSVVK